MDTTAAASNTPEAIEKMVPSKWCLGCKEWKRLELFARNSSKPDGLRSRCAACSAEQKQENRSRYKAREFVMIPAEKRCPKCGETKPRTRFGQKLGTFDGLADHCKPCSASYRPSNKKPIAA